MILIFSRFEQDQTADRTYIATSTFEVPSHHRRTVTPENQEAIIYNHSALAIGTIDATGRMEVFGGVTPPVSVEMVIRVDGSRALANPVKHAARPRQPKWKHDGGPFLY